MPLPHLLEHFLFLKMILCCCCYFLYSVCSAIAISPFRHFWRFLHFLQVLISLSLSVSVGLASRAVNWPLLNAPRHGLPPLRLTAHTAERRHAANCVLGFSLSMLPTSLSFSNVLQCSFPELRPPGSFAFRKSDDYMLREYIKFYLRQEASCAIFNTVLL